MILKNKKADERYLSPWMFLIWVIIAVSIVIGVVIFISIQADARLAEADVLSMSLIDCLANPFNITLFNSSSFNIYSYCGLNERLFSSEYTGKDILYLKIQITDSSGVLKTIEGGNKAFDTQCTYQFDNNVLESNLAQCSKKVIDIMDLATGKEYAIMVIVASNQKGEVAVLKKKTA